MWRGFDPLRSRREAASGPQGRKAQDQLELALQRDPGARKKADGIRVKAGIARWNCDQAITDGTRAIGVDPDFARAYEARAKAQLRKDEHDRAIDIKAINGVYGYCAKSGVSASLIGASCDRTYIADQGLT